MLISMIAHISWQTWQKVISICLGACLLAGCSLSLESLATPAPVTPASIPVDATASTVATEAVALPTLTPTPEGLYQPMALPDDLRDEMPVMQGICYEAARDAAGRIFVLRSADEHIRFYAQTDESKLCRHPVTRQAFNFSTGRVLVGFWQIGQGCTAHHDVQAVDRDETAKTITLRITFITEGTCVYELVRPFWVSLPDATGYEITVVNE